MYSHVIVEGPDGSGKTGFVGKFIRAFPWYLRHSRASDSRNGPVPALSQWVINDTPTMTKREPSVYDRHPLVSEPIYGPICRGQVPDRFNDPWWIDISRRRVAREALLVLCLPPYEEVRRNVRNEAIAQMPGAVDNIKAIYKAYTLVPLIWPGAVYVYDYTRNHSFADQIRKALVDGWPRSRQSVP